MDTRAQMTDAATVQTFIHGGRATFTLKSKVTSAHFTFKVTSARGDEDNRHFVAVLTGPDNTTDYRYVGTIFNRASYFHGKKATIGADAPSARAFAWAYAILATGRIPATVEVWHEGSCCRCGRTLTRPDSIASGVGPECAKRMAMAA